MYRYMRKIIKPAKRLLGEISLPGDKSISHRAIMLGAIARGETKAKGILDCDDCNFTIKAFKDMGIAIKVKGALTVISGKGLKGLERPSGEIRVGNSGTSMRLLAGILAGQDFEATLAGDESLSTRPMGRIVEPLSLMGVKIRAAGGDHPPLTIKGGIVKPIDYKMPVSSAQVKSAILLAGLYADGVTTVEEAFKSRDHTERMIKYFGAEMKVRGLKVSVKGGSELTGKSFEIPGDISSASFFMAGAVLLNGSEVRINKVSVNPTRAGILDVLSKMGADIKITNKINSFEPVADIEIKSGKTSGVIIEGREIPGIIDELPVLFVLASLSKGTTVIKGAKELRVKETDRIASMKEGLAKMGADLEVSGQNIIINGVSALKGAKLKSFGDHRTCMAMAIAALAAKGESELDDVSCVSKSFPEFFDTLERLTK